MYLIKDSDQDSNLHSYMKTLELNPTIKQLITTINFCFDTKYYDANELYNMWLRLKPEIQTSICSHELLTYISSIGNFSEANQSPAIYTKDNILNSVCIEDDTLESELFKASIALGQLSDELLARNPRYSWFLPSVCFHEILENIFSDEVNPGLIIGEHVDVLFPSIFPDYLKPYIEAKSVLKHHVRYGSALYNVIREMGIACIDLEKDLLVKACLFDCLNDLFPPSNACDTQASTSLKDLLTVLQKFPPLFFARWFHDCLLVENERLKSKKPTLDDLIIILACLPFGRGFAPLVSDEKIKAVMPKRRAISQLADMSRYSDLFNLEDFVSVVYIFGIYLETDGIPYELLSKFIRNITKYRTKFTCGTFPFSPETREYIYVVGTDISMEDNDLLIILTNGGMFTSANLCDSYYSLGLLPQADQYDKDVVIGLYNQKLDLYLTLVSKAHNNSLHELGAALLSLYLVYRTFYLKGHHNTSPRLAKEIINTLTLPGAKVLRHTLMYLVENIKKNYNYDPLSRASALFLRQFLPQSANLIVFPGKGTKETAVPEKDTADLLKTRLGVERWEKLNKDSQICLVSAEHLWKCNAADFGFGIRDFSALIMPYCKAIEGELLNRLDPFYNSEVYRTYLADTGKQPQLKPTAGWLMRELNQFSSLPALVQQAIEATGTRLHKDAKLVKDIKDLIRNYRNIAAHPPPVGMCHYAEFRKKLFEENLLHRFLDAL